MAAQLSYEYGVPFQSIIELSPEAFDAHVKVLEDIAKEHKNASRGARSRKR